MDSPQPVVLLQDTFLKDPQPTAYPTGSPLRVTRKAPPPQEEEEEEQVVDFHKEVWVQEEVTADLHHLKDHKQHLINDLHPRT